MSSPNSASPNTRTVVELEFTSNLMKLLVDSSMIKPVEELVCTNRESLNCASAHLFQVSRLARTVVSRCTVVRFASTRRRIISDVIRSSISETPRKILSLCLSIILFKFNTLSDASQVYLLINFLPSFLALTLPRVLALAIAGA